MGGARFRGLIVRGRLVPRDCSPFSVHVPAVGRTWGLQGSIVQQMSSHREGDGFRSVGDTEFSVQFQKMEFDGCP